MARLAGPLVLLLEVPEETSSGAAAVLCEDDSATGIYMSWQGQLLEEARLGKECLCLEVKDQCGGKRQAEIV